MLLLSIQMEGQGGWRLDSAEVFQIFQGAVLNPNLIIYKYNSEGRILSEKSNTIDREHFYGTHSYTVKNDFPNQGSSEYYTRSFKNAQVYSEFKSYNQEDSLTYYSKRFNFISERLDSIIQYDNDLLVNRIVYKYKDLRVSEYTSIRYYLDEIYSIQTQTFEYAEDGRLTTSTFRSITPGSYDNLTVNEYLVGESQDTVLTHYYYEGEFNGGSMRVSRIEEENVSILDNYSFAEEDVSDLELTSVAIYTTNAFPHRSLADQVEYTVFFGDSILTQKRTYSALEIDENQFRLTTVMTGFDFVGNVEFLTTNLSYYSKVETSDPVFNSEIEFDVFPNPIEVNSYFKIRFNQKAPANYYLYDSMGRLVQSLGIGGKEHILVYAPSQPGVYYVGFEDGTGERTITKPIVVH
jgi:hypothetical protein